MPLFGPRIRQIQRGQKDPEGFGVLFMLSVFGPTLLIFAIPSAPIWIPAVKAFLVAHPTIPATAFWQVIKSIVKGKNPVEKGLEAGMDAAAVALIVEFAKENFKFL